MIRLAWMVIVVVVCIGCISGCAQEIDSDSDFRPQVIDWQEREREAPTLDVDCPWGAGENIGMDLRSVVTQFQVSYEWDDVDWWKTSEETIIDGFGDCDDRASVVLRVIRDSCLPILYDGLDVRNRIVRTEDDTVHMLTVVYHGLETWTVDWQSVTPGEGPESVVMEYDLEFIY